MPKKKPAPRKKDIATFQVDATLLERLNEIAKAEDRPRSWVIRQLLIRALEAQEKTA